MDSCFGSWVIHTTLWRIVPRPPILCHFFVSFIFHIWQGQIWFGWHPKLVCTIFSRTGEYSYSRFFSVLTLPHGYATLRKGSCLEASLKTRIVELVKAKPKHLGAGEVGHDATPSVAFRFLLFVLKNNNMPLSASITPGPQHCPGIDHLPGSQCHIHWNGVQDQIWPNLSELERNHTSGSQWHVCWRAQLL